MNKYKMRIQDKVSLGVLFRIEIILVIVTVANIVFFSNKLLQEQKQELQLNATGYANVINAQFDMELGILNGLTNALVAQNSCEADDIQRMVDSFFERNPGHFNIYVGMTDGTFVSAQNNTSRPADYDPRTREWYISAVEKDGLVVINPYPAASGQTMCSTISEPLYLNGKLVGVVGLDVSVESIIWLVNQIEFEDGAYGFLVDSDGNYVTHPNEAFLPTGDERVSVADTYSELAAILLNPSSEIAKGTDYAGNKMFYATASVDSAGWVLGTAVPINLIIDDVQTSAWISMVLGIILGFIASFAISQKIKDEMNPISGMLLAINRIAEGDFSKQLDFSMYDDEIGVLQNELSSLVGIINDIIAQEKYILGEISDGNLTVADMDELPGEFNDIVESVNSIKATLNALISDIQFAAINIQSTALGVTGTTDPEEMRAVFEELSAEANELMDKANKFKTQI